MLARHTALVIGVLGALAVARVSGAAMGYPFQPVPFTAVRVTMFLLTGDARYMDVFERTAYNGFLSGVSVTGARFFYPNPLVYDGVAKNNHGFAGRAPWFGCACCPPNLMRTLASLTGYFYAVRDDSLYVNRDWAEGPVDCEPLRRIPHSPSSVTIGP